MLTRVRSMPFLVGLAVFAGSLALYVSTMPPTLAWGWKAVGVDGGEFLAAAKTLGIPHPPGYPTYMLLLKAFASVVRIGDYAFRGNLFSAVCAAGAVTLTYAACHRVVRAVWPGVSPKPLVAAAALGAATLAAGPLLWALAVVTEVYALNALFSALLLYLAAKLCLRNEGEGRHPKRRQRMYMAAFGLALGVGLGNHLTLFAVAIPLVYWMVLTMGWKRWTWLWGVAAVLAGLCVYVYLPLRAAAYPPINWGQADSFDGVVWMISGRPYHDYVFGITGRPLATRIVDWLTLVFNQLNPLGIFIGLVGLGFLRTAAPRLFEGLVAGVLLLMVYAVTYNTFDFQVLMIPMFVFFAVGVSAGLARILVDWLSRVEQEPARRKKGQARLEQWVAKGRDAFLRQPALVLGILAFALLPCLTIGLNYNEQNLRGDRDALELAERMMEQLPNGSVVLADSEVHVFPLWYMVYVEQQGRDVAVVSTRLLQFDWYRAQVQREFPDAITGTLPVAMHEAARAIVEQNVGGGNVYTTYPDTFLSQTYTLEGIGDVYKVGRKSE
ncbi:MAG: DUF2723 domain-containing protein [SAR202 cluster bacterium]|nr:DUF2723 domain-containing protein [SAR202 cluster bacterium]